MCVLALSIHRLIACCCVLRLPVCLCLPDLYCVYLSVSPESIMCLPMCLCWPDLLYVYLCVFVARVCRLSTCVPLLTRSVLCLPVLIRFVVCMSVFTRSTTVTLRTAGGTGKPSPVNHRPSPPIMAHLQPQPANRTLSPSVQSPAPFRGYQRRSLHDHHVSIQ